MFWYNKKISPFFDFLRLLGGRDYLPSVLNSRQIPTQGGEKMKEVELVQFEYKVKSILEWSPLDPNTREVLANLMKEVANLVQKRN